MSSKATLDPFSRDTRRSLRDRLREATGLPAAFTAAKSHSVDSGQRQSAAPKDPVHRATDNPTQTTHITVDGTDTLASLAAKYSSTPAELLRLNRLSTRTLFPGQRIKVPAAAAADSVFSPTTPLVLQKKFIKLRTRHITDGNGVVTGTLLITPNAVMFDPNVSDPLVLDQGADKYGVILPIELVVNAGILSDISGMRVMSSVEGRSDGVLLYGESGGRAEGEPKDGDGVEPWYLRLTTGYPSTLSRNLSLISYGQKRFLKPEYWFSIPSEDTQSLYEFLTLAHPTLYGELDEEALGRKGYKLVNWDTDLSSVLAKDTQVNEVSELNPSVAELTRESWEMIKAPYGKLYSLLQRGQTILSSSCDSHGSTSSAPPAESEFEIVSLSELEKSNEYFFPELLGHSMILGEGHVRSICKHLTARAEGYPWLLVFSTELHGFSLSSLYRRMETVDEWSPVLLVIQDTHSRIFGALVSAPLKISEHFYGTGQSFLFRFDMTEESEEAEEAVEPPASASQVARVPTEHLHVYKWTGENLFFIRGNPESLQVGAGDGRFGLWLDSDLNVGRSDGCWTYGNPPLVEERDFVVKTCEAWAFGATPDPPPPPPSSSQTCPGNI